MAFTRLRLFSQVSILHIADATADELQADHIGKVGLLGTRFTMEQDFYKGRLTEHHGIEVVTPSEHSRTIVHDVIYQELCLGQIRVHNLSKYHWQYAFMSNLLQLRGRINS